MFATVQFEYCLLSEPYAVEIELVHQCRRLEAVDVVDLAKSLAARLRLAEFGIERGQLTAARRADQQVVEVGPRQRQVLLELCHRAFQLFDLRQPDFLVLRLAFARDDPLVRPVLEFIAGVFVLGL